MNLKKWHDGFEIVMHRRKSIWSSHMPSLDRFIAGRFYVEHML